MWWNTARRLRQALRRYQTDKNLEAVLHTDWRRAPDLKGFFDDIEKRLHGDEITRLQQKQAEYLALQNQINPHFLYNALEAIRADALLADCGEIAETTEALATFFRYTISNVQEYVTFSDELDNAENYFTIQRCRFGDKLSMELEMENEALLEARMPKLILQPLVENAVKYGFQDIFEGGVIRIVVKKDEGALYLSVANNGTPIEQSMMEKINHMNQLPVSELKECFPDKKHGYGVVNILTRLRLKYGDGAAFYCEAEADGTICTIKIPGDGGLKDDEE